MRLARVKPAARELLEFEDLAHLRVTLGAIGAKMIFVIHARMRHQHPAVLTALDVSLVVIMIVLTLWAVFLLAMLIHGATNAGA